ncbi:MAG TPA: short-chain fatty acid transporter [Crocinitomix sp.]|nr:short-chain fatty acid transporter [Crocinitomix sp.]
MTFADKFAEIFKTLLPSPFSIAIILTFLAFIFAYFGTENNSIINLITYWEEGLWNKSGGGLYFAFQMMLMLVLGYVLALSEPVSNLINKLTLFCTNSANSALIVTFSTVAVSLFNWGLGLIFGAILARKIGEKFNLEQKPLNYGLIGASAYSGLMVWHGGISGSAPIKATEKGNLKELLTNTPNINLNDIPETIPFDATVFSLMNISISVALLIILPFTMYLIGKKDNSFANLPKKTQIKDIKHKVIGAEIIDYSRWFSLILGILFLTYAFYKAIVLPDEFSLGFINPNFINFILFGFGFLLHKNIAQFLKSANEAISGATGILIQFPLYFGILGIMVGSGLITQISDSFANISNEITFPILTFFSAGLVNIFVPSGGAQWAVQGPIIISAAQELGVSLPKSIMALAYGDQLTNMLQPFWALPLLGITGLKAKDILPYTLILFIIGGLIFLIGLLIF